MKNVFLHTMYAVAMAAIVSSCVEAVQEDAPAELLTPSISVGQSTSGDSFTVEWTSVPNAVSYAYSLNGASEVSTAELSVTFQDMEPGSYNVRVKALAPDGGAYLDSQWGSCDFELVAGAGADSDQERLGKPELKAENVTWDSFSVVWSAVEGAGEYVYSLNGGEEITTSATEVEFTGLEAGDYRVRVKATEGGALADSYWAAITVTVYSQDEDFSLDKPVLRVENQTETSFTVAWNVVENASYYMYRLNGAEPIQTYSTSVDFTDCGPGDYIVEVKAVPAEGTVYKDSEWASITVILEDPADPEDPDDPENPENPDELDITGYYLLSDGEYEYEYYIEQAGSTVYYIYVPFTSDPFRAVRSGNTLQVAWEPVPTDLSADGYGIVDVYMCAYHPDNSDPANETYYLWPGEEPVWEFDAGGVTLVNGTFIGFINPNNDGWLNWTGSALKAGTYGEKLDSSSAPAAVLSAPGAVKPSVLHNVAR